MTTNGSFYQNGLPISSVETGLGNVPAPPVVPKTAESSFYLSGSAYAALANTDALTALFNSSVTATAASAAAAAASAASVPALLTSYALKTYVDAGDATEATARTTADAAVTTAFTAADTALSGTLTTALGLKAPLASPALTGVPTAPTATIGTNTTQLATTAFVLANSSAGGVTSIGTQTGALTIAGGNLSSSVLPVSRYDVAQALTSAQKLQNRTNISAILRGQLWGLTLSVSGATATFGTTAGEAADSTSADLMAIASAYTKTTGAWAVGTGNGALDTGTIASSTWYAVFLIKRPDTGVVDLLVSLSATAPTLPTNYTLFRRIGWLRTIAGVFWKPITQVGSKFYWTTPVADANALTVGVTRVLITITAPPTSVAFVRGLGYNASALTTFLVQPTAELDQAPSSSSGYMLANEVINGGGTSSFVVPVDSSSQIAARAATASSVIDLATYGYDDDRGVSY